MGSPLLLGFDDFEALLERFAKLPGDGYPPFNVERTIIDGGVQLRIVLAVAGFAREQLEIVIEGQQLAIRGQQAEEAEESRSFLHRGIAARQFKRTFILADGTRVVGAQLSDGMLTISLERAAPAPARRIAIA